jgi:hypothetical protein
VYLPLAAEFLGRAAVRFEQWLEIRLRNGPFDQFLWVQFYVAEKQGVGGALEHSQAAAEREMSFRT